jgi:cystathionine beta-lyase
MLLAAPARAGKALVRAPMRERVADGISSYTTDFDALERGAKSAGLFYLCNPHNPIGAVYAREELEQFARFAKEHNLVVVSDEIHAEIVYGKPHIPYISVDGGLENSILLTAPGKICNMPGIPGAVAVVPDENLRERVKKIYPRVSLGALNLSAIAGAYAAECDAWKSALTDSLKINRDYLERELLRRFPKATVTHTEGTYLQWVDFSAYALGDAQKWLLEHAKIAPTGGADFGGTEHHIRINFGCPKSTLTAVLDRIQSAKSDWR